MLTFPEYGQIVNFNFGDMKVEKVMINGKGYYRFRECGNIQNRCALCCFSKGGRCDLPFPCEAEGYYVLSDDCSVRIGNATINVDLPAPPEVGDELKVKEGEAAAEQRPTERSEKEAGEDGNGAESKEPENKEPEVKEPKGKEDGKASGADVIVLDKADKNFVSTGIFKADRIKREGSIGKRSYYEFPNGVEAEDICRYLSFNLGNVVKYACRAGRKDAKKKIEDLQKARDYLDNEIKRLEEGDE